MAGKKPKAKIRVFKWQTKGNPGCEATIKCHDGQVWMCVDLEGELCYGGSPYLRMSSLKQCMDIIQAYSVGSHFQAEGDPIHIR